MHLPHSEPQAKTTSTPSIRASRILRSPLVQAAVISIAILLTIFLLNGQSHQRKIHDLTSLGEMVDVAGRQRMLSQRIAKNLLLLAEQGPAQGLETQLAADVKLLNVDHLLLLESGTPYENAVSEQQKPAPHQLLNQITPLILNITSSVDQVLSAQQTAQSALPGVLNSEKQLIPLIDQYNESLTAGENLLESSYHQYQLISDSLLMFGLSAVLFSVIWYLLRRIQNHQERLKQERHKLRHSMRKMKEKQEKLSAAISASFYETWTWTEATGEFWCSESFWRVFGYADPAEYPESTFQKFQSHLASPNRGLLRNAIQEHRQDEEPFRLELLACNEQGKTRWIRIQARLMKDELKNREYLAGTVEDIHEDMAAKLQLDHQENLLSKVGKVAKIGGWHLDLTTNEVFWTSELYRLHEVDDDFTPTVESGLAFYAADSRPELERALDETIETGKPFDLELSFTTAKGRNLWVRVQGELEYELNKPVRLIGAFQDISVEKRKEMEILTMQEEKNSSRARLQSIISAATEVSIIATDLHGTITLFSPGAERLLGYSADEVIGLKSSTYFHLDEEIKKRGKELSKTLGKSISEFETFVTPAMLGGFDQREWTYVCKDGSHRTVELTVTAIRNEAEQIEGYLGVAVDVTQKKENEKQLLESREKIRHLMDALPVATYTCDQDGLITYFNQAAVEFWERTPQLNDPTDRYCGAFQVLDDKGKVLAPETSWTASVLKEQQPLRGKEFVIKTPEGTTKTALAHISPMHDLEGNLTGVVNVLVDISDLKSLEDSLRDTTTRLEVCLKVLDQHAIIAETELNGRIRHVNEKFCEISGYDKNEVIGNTHRIVNSGIHPKEFWQDVFKTVAVEGMWQGEICNRKKSGELYWVDTTIATMKNGEGLATGYLAIRNDITDLKLAQKAALAASQSKSEFLANMSHEIRTPLTAILGYADLLKADPEFLESTEKRDQAISTILDAGNHLLTVINDILDLSKIEAGKMEVEKTPTDVFNTLEHIESLLRPRAISKGVQLGSQIETPIPNVIASDPTRLRQILMNLVGNAVKFTEQGKIKINVRLIERNFRKYLQFDIEDSGPGMSPRQAEKIFQAFSQADNSLTRQHGGTGLGLVISRKLTRLMGGEVSLHWTEKGKGTCFRVELPEHPLPETRYLISPSLVDPETPQNTSTSNYQVPENTRILLAEDGPDNQRLISFLLKKLGALVDVADNGSIAYRNYLESIIAEQPYHMIITDIQMPEMDGYSLTKVLRAEGATLPIIALTAHAMAEDRQKCLDAGCDDYLSKPVDRRLLRTTIEKWLSKEMPEAEAPAVPETETTETTET